jgi:hypothetical protein
LESALQQACYGAAFALHYAVWEAQQQKQAKSVNPFGEVVVPQTAKQF